MRAGWKPITDFEADPKTLTDGELESLSRVWVDQKAALSEEGTLEEFDKRLRREWSIETGIIENVYTLDRSVTKTLIEKGIDAALIPHDASNRDSVVVARLIQDHYDALEGLFDFVGGQRQLSTEYIKELHAALLRNQDFYAVVDQFGKVFEKPLEKGLYKTLPNNPTRPDGTVHEYCPAEHVASEMDRLVAMHGEHWASGVPVEVEAAWLHHRFTQIHPFADGNGRVARAIASLVLINAGWLPLIVQREGRNAHIDALEKADEGDLKGLVTSVVDAQRGALIQATEVAYEVHPPLSTEEAIEALERRVLQAGKLPREEWAAAKRTAIQLERFARERFQQIADRFHARGLEGELKEVGVGLVLTASSNALELSFRSLGQRSRGLISVLPLLMQGPVPTVIEGGSFLINYAESYDHAHARFSAWLERVIVAGLNQWRLTL
jgi:fido (protein-threonine AMPylation protein)